MKRALLGFTVVAFLFAGSFSANAEESILKEVEDANTNEKLIENNERVGIQNIYHLADGTLSSAYRYVDSERSVYEDEYEIRIMEGEEIYGFDQSNHIAYRVLCLDDAIAFWNVDMEVIAYQQQGGEEIVEEKEEDGITTISCSMTEGTESYEQVRFLAENLGYDVSEYTVVSEEFKLNERKEVIGGSLSVQKEDGTEKVVLVEINRLEDPELYEVAPEILEELNADSQRTVKIIADPGTEDEMIYEKTVGKGCSVLLQNSYEHPELFMDEACTIVFEGADDRESDVLLYTVKVSE